MKIDCDVHPAIPELPDLLPWLDAYWRDHVTTRGVRNLDLVAYRPSLPTTARADWRPETGRAAPDPARLAAELLEPFGIDIAILNPVHGGAVHPNSYFGRAICHAVNGWLAECWLDRDDRLRGAISVPIQEPDMAVEEIEARAGDSRFVQILFPIAGDVPFGRRQFWPIYRAAVKHGLPVAIHPGGNGRFPQSYVGWHSTYAEELFLQSGMVQGQLLSLVHEGVFQEFPDLRVVMLESGVTWLPAFLADTDNKWMALRREVPWVTEAPSTLIKRHVRFTTQPFDAPSAAHVARIVEMIAADEILLFSTDYPHWQFEGTAAVPEGIGPELAARIAGANPAATYGRLALQPGGLQ